MDVFKFRDRIIENYSCYFGRFIQIQDDRFKQTLSSEPKDGLPLPDSLLQLNPAFAWGGWIDKLVS